MCSCTLSPNEHQKGVGREGSTATRRLPCSIAGEVVPARGTTEDRSGNLFLSLYHQVTWTVATPMKRGGEEGRSMAAYPTILSQVSLKAY